MLIKNLNVFDEEGFAFESAGKKRPIPRTKNELLPFYQNNWTKNENLFDVEDPGIQCVTIPKSGKDEIKAAGAINVQKKNFAMHRHHTRRKMLSEKMLL